MKNHARPNLSAAKGVREIPARQSRDDSRHQRQKFDDTVAQLSFDSGNSSGSNPYLVGPNIAPIVLMKKTEPQLPTQVDPPPAPRSPDPSPPIRLQPSISSRCACCTCRPETRREWKIAGRELKIAGAQSTQTTKSRSSLLAAVSKTRKLTSHFNVLSQNTP